jgi:hypothetical protein
MKRRWDRYFAVVLLVVGVVALLPVTGVYTNTSCTWTQAPSAKGTSPFKAGNPSGMTLSLSVRAGDNELTKKLRAGIEKGLTDKGFSKLVDNPVARPRAQIVIEEMAGRWTPFWAPLSMKARVLVNERKGAGDVLDATYLVDGKCTGLVSREQWQSEPLDLVVAGVLQELVPGG